MAFGDAGNDFIDAGAGRDILTGDGGLASFIAGQRYQVQTLNHFTGGADTLISGTGNDVVLAGYGNDGLSGNLDFDILVGEYARLTYTDEKITTFIRLAQNGIGYIGGNNFDIYLDPLLETIFQDLGITRRITGTISENNPNQYLFAALDIGGTTSFTGSLEPYEPPEDGEFPEEDQDENVPEDGDMADPVPEELEIPPEKGLEGPEPEGEEVPRDETPEAGGKEGILEDGAEIKNRTDNSEDLGKIAALFAGFAVLPAVGKAIRTEKIDRDAVNCLAKKGYDRKFMKWTGSTLKS